jgi:hypothetical protein
LFAVAEASGGEWPERARRASLDCHAMPDESTRTQLLADIQAVFAEKSCDRLTSGALVSALVAMTDRPWGECNHGKGLTQNQLARRLKPFDIAPKTIRTGIGTAKGYLLENFEDSFNRYLSADTPLQTVTPSQTSKINDLGENQAVTPKTDVTVSKSSNQLNSFTCDGVTDENPLPGAGRGVTDKNGGCESAAPRVDFAGRQAWRTRL